MTEQRLKEHFGGILAEELKKLVNEGGPGSGRTAGAKSWRPAVGSHPLHNTLVAHGYKHHSQDRDFEDEHINSYVHNNLPTVHLHTIKNDSGLRHKWEAEPDVNTIGKYGKTSEQLKDFLRKAKKKADKTDKENGF